MRHWQCGVLGPAAAGRWVCRALPLILVALLTACTSEDHFRRYARAVGPDLYSAQTVRNTRLLDAYTAQICTQAGLAVGGRCTLSTPADWREFVDMGLYDIDQRCDAFLDSLYYKETTNDSVLSQIADVGTFTGAVLEISKSSSVAIRIVAKAFDLAEDTFRNTNQTLLDALDPTTVKSLVFRNQQIIKQQIDRTTITNKPRALHALRTYLRVCMPFAIEMEANAILTTVHRTEGERVGESPITFSDAKPLEPKQEFGTKPRPTPRGAQPLPGFETLFVAPSKYGKQDLIALQNAMCLQPYGVGAVGDKTRAAARIFEDTTLPLGRFGDFKANSTNRKIDDFEFNFLAGLQPCDPNEYGNFFERANYEPAISGAEAGERKGQLIELLNLRLGLALPKDLRLSDPAVRDAIAAARTRYGTATFNGLGDRFVTPPLALALSKPPSN